MHWWIEVLELSCPLETLYSLTLALCFALLARNLDMACQRLYKFTKNYLCSVPVWCIKLMNLHGVLSPFAHRKCARRMLCCCIHINVICREHANLLVSSAESMWQGFASVNWLNNCFYDVSTDLYVISKGLWEGNSSHRHCCQSNLLYHWCHKVFIASYSLVVILSTFFPRGHTSNKLCEITMILLFEHHPGADEFTS